MIKIRFFAALRDIVGQPEMELDLPADTSTAEIYQKLEQDYPDLKKYRKILLVAVNAEYTDWDQRVKPGDEVAFFPPVSGGSR